MCAEPARVLFSPPHVRSNRSNNNNDDLRVKLPNSSGQLNLTRQTNAQARLHIHLVNRPPAKINEITTQ